jgi:hypothetical protein
VPFSVHHVDVRAIAVGVISLTLLAVSGCGGDSQSASTVVGSRPGVTAPTNTNGGAESVTTVALTVEQQDVLSAWNAFLDAYSELLAEPSGDDKFSAAADLATDQVAGSLLSISGALEAKGQRAEFVVGESRTRTKGPSISIDVDLTLLVDCVVLPLVIVDANGAEVFPDAPRDAFFDARLILVDGVWIVEYFQALESCPIA